MKRLNDNVVIITGAASGMGRAMALLFSKQGAKVVASDINEESLSKVVKEIQDEGNQAIGIVCNVAKQEDVEHLIDQAIESFGKLDILVNNAGIMDNFLPAHEVDNDTWNRVFAVNTNSVMYSMRKAIPIFMKQGKGVILNIASAAGVVGARAGMAYTASKHAVVGMTKNAAFMYAKEGVRINAILPGGINTNIGTTMTNPSHFGYGKTMPGMELNPRFGESEEIARAALYLVSDEASFVNGALLAVDGGWMAY
ncbi:MAG TPA: 3-ketoacyl-ACP reductase [Erysipelotrichaceae bacterium]|nr:3-ketoacyl-ACP reductase [Erysipelotrichaceae bacterium]